MYVFNNCRLKVVAGQALKQNNHPINGDVAVSVSWYATYTCMSDVCLYIFTVPHGCTVHTLVICTMMCIFVLTYYVLLCTVLYCTVL